METTLCGHRAGIGAGAGRRRAVPFLAVAAVALAVGAAGCGDGSGQGTGARTAAAASGQGTATTRGTSAPSPAAPPATVDAPPPVSASGAVPSATGRSASATAGPRQAAGRCASGDLAMRLGRGDPGAGQTFYPLYFTNTSGRTCVLDGFPGVSLTAGDGTVIGRPAGREGPVGGQKRLTPGATAEADLHTLNQGVRGSGCWHRPAALKAYPPGSRDALTLATADLVVCGDTFGVGSVH